MFYPSSGRDGQPPFTSKALRAAPAPLQPVPCSTSESAPAHPALAAASRAGCQGVLGVGARHAQRVARHALLGVGVRSARRCHAGKGWSRATRTRSWETPAPQCRPWAVPATNTRKCCSTLLLSGHWSPCSDMLDYAPILHFHFSCKRDFSAAQRGGPSFPTPSVVTVGLSGSFSFPAGVEKDP